MILDFLYFVQAIDLIYYVYLFLSLAGIFIIVTLKKMALENEINKHISEAHPEQKARRDNNIRLYVLQMTLSILMAMVFTIGIFRYSYKEIEPVTNVSVVASETEDISNDIE